MAASIDEIDNYFKKKGVDDRHVRLNHYLTVVNPKLFVNTSIRILRANPGNKDYKEAYILLNTYYKKCLEEEKR